MKRICILAVSMTIASLAAHAADDAASAPQAATSAPAMRAERAPPPVRAAIAAPISIPNGDFCLYAGSPPSDVRYRSLGHVKLSKGTYGGVRDELPAFVAEARAKGADAITSYNGAQRFGFWPWRMVHPVLRGIAVKFDDGKVPDCTATGGSTLATVMATNVEPARQ